MRSRSVLRAAVGGFARFVGNHRRLVPAGAHSSDSAASANEPSVASPSSTAASSGSSSSSDANPHAHIKIFRKELSGDGSSFPPLSVDMSAKQLRELFNDYDGKRCKLCGESYMAWHTHTNFIPHSARESILFELLRAHCGTPEEIVAMWWHRLHTSTVFRRIPQLSDGNSLRRKRKLHYLLKFLHERRVIRDTFDVAQQNNSAGRSWVFERLEWVGDNVVKYVFNDRINVLFPVHEGGVKGRLGYVQSMIDGNDGLARAYDYLQLHKLTRSDRVVSKFKSDVVETLFGELQMYLWSTEVDEGTEYFAHPFTPEHLPLRSLVEHTMNELAHVMLMYHVEYILSLVQRLVKEHQLQFVRADPAQRSAKVDHSVRTHAAATGTASANRKLSGTRKAHPRAGDAAALYAANTDVSAFSKVAIGGLRTQPVAAGALRPCATFLPHLQRAPELEAMVEESGWQEQARSVVVAPRIVAPIQAAGNATLEALRAGRMLPAPSDALRWPV